MPSGDLRTAEVWVKWCGKHLTHIYETTTLQSNLNLFSYKLLYIRTLRGTRTRTRTPRGAPELSQLIINGANSFRVIWYIETPILYTRTPRGTRTRTRTTRQIRNEGFSIEETRGESKQKTV